MRLCAIFHHLDAACVAERDDGLDLGQLTVQMGHDHGLGRGLARERSLQCGDGHQSRACTGIDEDRRRTTGQNGAGAVHGGIGHHGDPIALANAQCLQREFQGVGAVGDADAVAGATVAGELLLEGLHVRAEDVVAAGDDVAGDLRQLVLQGSDVAGKRVDRNQSVHGIRRV